MASTNTLYVEFLNQAKLVDQTIGFGVRDDEIYAHLGYPHGGSWNKLDGVDGLTWLTTRYPPQNANCGWAETDAGIYTPRFYRGGYMGGGMAVMRQLSDPEMKEATAAEEQVDILDSDLIDISRSVTPSVKNQQADGSNIRNVLMLAATEVESQCKGTLKANGYPPPVGRHMNTTDYVKVCAPMRLDEYSVRLQRHRDYPAIWPFKGWVPGVPGNILSTKSLPWYDAYNQTKHDREASFEKASLEHAITAVAAVHVLLFAQYGATTMRQIARDSFFMLEDYPHWHHKDRTYPPLPGEPWTPVLYSF